MSKSKPTLKTRLAEALREAGAIGHLHPESGLRKQWNALISEVGVPTAIGTDAIRQEHAALIERMKALAILATKYDQYPFANHLELATTEARAALQQLK